MNKLETQCIHISSVIIQQRVARFLALLELQILWKWPVMGFNSEQNRDLYSIIVRFPYPFALSWWQQNITTLK